MGGGRAPMVENKKQYKTSDKIWKLDKRLFFLSTDGVYRLDAHAMKQFIPIVQ